MHVYNVDSDNLKVFLKENNRVIMGVYQENCPISSLFIGMLKQLRKIINKNEVIIMIKKEEYMKYFKLNKVSVCPKTIIFKNGIIEKVIDGFKNCEEVYQNVG